MSSFDKLFAQLKEGDVLQGNAMLEKQPKEHLFIDCSATLTKKEADSLTLSTKFSTNDSNLVLPTEITIQTSNVMEHENKFRIVYYNKNVLILFVVSNMYY